ncbi:hypothetical protein LCGC14_3048560, partial [marine sediment metagenome]
IDMHMAVSETDLNLSDRLTVQLVANIAGGGGDPIVEVQIEGETAARVELVVPGANVGTFVPYSGAIRNLDLGANNFSVDSSVFFVNSNTDRVGIGTTSPAVNLQLGNVGGGPKQIIIHADGDALTLKQDVAGDDTFQSWYTAGGVRRGYFGYGQGLSDNLTLSNEVGGITFTGIDEDDVGIEDGKYLILLNDPDTATNKQKGLAFGRADNDIIAGIEPHIPAGGGGHLDFYTAATGGSLSRAMRIDQDGNISIGGTSSGDKLTIYDTSSVNVRVQSAGPDADAGVVLRTATAPYWTIYEDESNSQKFIIRDSVGGDRLTIDTSGNVGINTTTPQNLLNVLGDINFTGLIYGNGSQL